MPDMHYLPSTTVNRSYDQRLTIRGEDVDILIELLDWLEGDPHVDDLSPAMDFIERVRAAVTH